MPLNSKEWKKILSEYGPGQRIGYVITLALEGLITKYILERP